MRICYLTFLVFALLSFAAAEQQQLAADQLSTAPAFGLESKKLAQYVANSNIDRSHIAAILLEENKFVFDSLGRQARTRHLIYLITSQEGLENWSNIEQQWSPWYQEKPRVRARVVSPEGTEHWLDPGTLLDETASQTQNNIFTDERVLQGPLPSVGVGSIVEEEEVITDFKPDFGKGTNTRLRFGAYVPVLHDRLVISVPDASPLQYVTQLLPQVRISKTHSNGILEVTFEAGPIDAIEKTIENLPSDAPSWPHVEFATGSSWQEIANGYAQLSDPKIRPEEVQDLVDSTKMAGDGRDLVIRRLVSTLHKRVRYTGVEFGESELVPRFPSEVMKRGYGDCKDKAALLVSMLRAAKVQSFLALLSTGPGQDVEETLPGMGSFDHAIVYVPGPPALWIDATDDYARVGQLPRDDQDRLALVIAPETKQLVRTSSSQSADNLLVERREFFLVENGPSRILETSEPQGTVEAIYRSAYEKPESKDAHKSLEDYMKRAYLAENLSALKHSDSHNLDAPFTLQLEAAKAKRGLSTINDAVVAIFLSPITERLPAYFSETEEEHKNNESAQRKEEFVFADPFVTEWQYRIAVPEGFKVRALPKDQTEMFGPAKLSQHYEIDSDRLVSGTIRFDTVKRRYNAEEATALRAAVLQLQKRDAVLIGFDQVGHLLLTQNKIRGALAAFNDLVKLHPKEALHHVQIARALLSGGLGERAREEARRATELEPNSALAWQTLGLVLEHDLIGRRFKKGFDLEKSIAAYRKAKQLAPKEYEGRMDLAILLEHDLDGERYSSTARLADAIQEYEELKKEKVEIENLDDNLIFALIYAGRYGDARNRLTEIAATEARYGLLLTSVAADKGASQAIDESLRILSDEHERSNVLRNASSILMHLRLYPQAAELMQASIRGQTDASTKSAFVAALKTTFRAEDLRINDSEPESAVQKIMRFMFTKREWTAAQLLPFFSKEVAQAEQGDAQAEHKTVGNPLRVMAEQSSIPVPVLGDIALSNLRFSKDGSDASGYRVRMVAMAAATQTGFVVKEAGGFKLIALQEEPSTMALEILRRIDGNDLDSARQWLDWARDLIHLQSGDDPLGGPIFPRFWVEGQSATTEQMREAAWSLLAESNTLKKWLPSLYEAAKHVTAESERNKMDLMLTVAANHQKDWKKAQESAADLIKAYPDSERAFLLYFNASMHLKNWSEIDNAIETRKRHFPADLAVLRTSARKFEEQGNIQQAIEAMRPIVESGRATAQDLNQFAWDALVAGAVSPEALDAARRGTQLTSEKNFAVLHTLACLEAATGKATEARELLLKAMDANGMAEPNSEIWYGMGLIAEQYGETAAALENYSRVEEPAGGDYGPTWTYALAQKRIKVLTGSRQFTATGIVH